MACELPEKRSVPLSAWDCQELARQLVADEVVPAISPESVRRILAGHHLKPWRIQAWLSPRVPRDAAFRATVHHLVDLYTRPLDAGEVVLCIDEKTNLQPRRRTAPSTPAGPRRPMRIEHEYIRDGALHLFAAFNTRTGTVLGMLFARKRAAEFVAFLEHLDVSIPESTGAVHLVLDNLSVHKSRAVAAWLAAHPRFQLHFPPVHCSWLNQVEQWFSILQRKALRAPNFRDREALATHVSRYISHWNHDAHPFNWTTGSAARVMAKLDLQIAHSA